MVIDIITGLTSSSKRDLARNLFPGFWDRGISANAALKELQSAGLGYKRQDFLNDFRQGESAFDQASKIRFVTLDSVPSEGILAPLYHGVPDKYSFLFRVEGSDPNTGEDQTRYFFYHTNQIQSRAALEDQASDWLTEQADSGDNQSSGAPIDIASVSIRAGYINPVWA